MTKITMIGITLVTLATASAAALGHEQHAHESYSAGEPGNPNADEQRSGDGPLRHGGPRGCRHRHDFRTMAAGDIERLAAMHALADVIFEQHAARFGQRFLDIGGEQRAEIGAALQLLRAGAACPEQIPADAIRRFGFHLRFRRRVPNFIENIVELVHGSLPYPTKTDFCRRARVRCKVTATSSEEIPIIDAISALECPSK